jgi:hypothetical protein
MQFEMKIQEINYYKKQIFLFHSLSFFYQNRRMWINFDFIYKNLEFFICF